MISMWIFRINLTLLVHDHDDKNHDYDDIKDELTHIDPWLLFNWKRVWSLQRTSIWTSAKSLKLNLVAMFKSLSLLLVSTWNGRSITSDRYIGNSIPAPLFITIIFYRNPNVIWTVSSTPCVSFVARKMQMIPLLSSKYVFTIMK